MWQSASRVALMCVFLGAFRSSNRQGGIGARLASSCAIAGYDSGVCWESERLLAEISYCADVVQYKACGPQPPTDSSFNNVTIKLKDEWVRQMTETIIEERIAAETNDLDINEYGDPGFTVKRFSDGAPAAEDCKDSFKAYMCYINFPRCDEQDKSLIMCTSACQNLMDTCRIPYDMQRCGPPEWHNGNEPEEMLYYNDAGSYPILMRDFFPGQPFREPEFEDVERTVSKVVCTPSLPGAATTFTLHMAIAGASAVALLASL